MRTDGSRRSQRGKRSPWGRTAIAVAGFAVLTAACGGSTGAGAPTTTGTTTPTEVVAGAPTATFVDGRCAVIVADAAKRRCGTLTVAEDRSSPGRTVSLPVVVLKTTVANPPADPVVVITGPGVLVLDVLEGDLALPDRVGRDVVLFDQRGVGRATPSLECENEPHLDTTDSSAEARAIVIATVTKCRDRYLADGVNLSAYDMDALVADVIDLRHTLGYEKWNLIGRGQTNEVGPSGGTVALHVAHRDPDGVRSMVLEQVIPPQVDPYAAQVPNIDRAQTALFDLCTASAACAGSYPDLAATFTTAMAAPPSRLTGHTERGEPVLAIFDAPHISEAVADGLAQSDLHSVLPNLIAGSPQPVADAFANSPGFLLNVTRLTSMCRDVVPFADHAARRSAVSAYGLVSYALPADEDTCAAWGVKPADSAIHAAVTSSVPTLLISGGLDPFADPAWAILATRTLAHATVVHDPVTGNDSLAFSDCVRRIRNAFVAEPSEVPDSSCLAEESIDFAPPG